MAMFEGAASKHATASGYRIIIKAQATSASYLTLALSFEPRSETIFKMVSKPGSALQTKPFRNSPWKALHLYQLVSNIEAE